MVMTKSELLSLAEIKGHEIIYMDFSKNEAMSAEINGKCYIGLDALNPEADEKELLAHELGHCEYAGFYSRLTPMNTRERVEYRAHKWQLIHLVPLGELRDVYKRQHLHMSQPVMQLFAVEHILHVVQPLQQLRIS